MDRPSRMETGVAIARLIKNSEELFDLEAARTVIDFVRHLPPTSKISEISKKQKGDSITGHTSEHGNVTVGSEHEHWEEKTTTDGQVERIGHYKVWKHEQKGGEECRIHFYRFWASDPNTQSDKTKMPSEYILTYDKKTYKPIILATLEKRPMYVPVFSELINLTFFILTIGYIYIKFSDLFFEVLQSENICFCKKDLIWAGYFISVQIK